MTEPDPVKTVSLANAVELARSTEPILAEVAAEVAAVVLTVADTFEAWLRKTGDPVLPPQPARPNPSTKVIR